MDFDALTASIQEAFGAEVRIEPAEDAGSGITIKGRGVLSYRQIHVEALHGGPPTSIRQTQLLLRRGDYPPDWNPGADDRAVVRERPGADEIAYEIVDAKPDWLGRLLLILGLAP